MASPTGLFFYGGKWYFQNAQGNVAVANKPSANERQLTQKEANASNVIAKVPTAAPQVPVAAAPAPPAAAPAAPVAPPPLTPGANDPEYWNQQTSNYESYHGQADPLQAQLATLTHTDASGKTQYDYAQSQLQHDNAQSQYGSNASLAARGVFNSGSRASADTQLANQYAQQSQQNDATLGQQAQSQLQNQLSSVGGAYGYDPSGNYVGGGIVNTNTNLASTQRQQQQGGAPDPTDPAAIAAQTAGAPPKTYAKGFYQVGGQWRFQNAQGVNAAATNYKPGKGTVLTSAQVKV